MTEKETVQVRVRGKVQGVGFRAATMRHAHLYQVGGWVSNAPDGSVEVLLQGHPDQIDRMVSWLHKGPEHAVVEQVELERVYTGRPYPRFEIR